jgi:hypothetical protein
MARYTVSKRFLLPPDLVRKVEDESKKPEYEHNKRPSEAAVVRKALELFFASQSNLFDKELGTAA